MNNEIYRDAKVLLVDDNQINLYVLNRVFEQFGIEADCVPSGVVCLKKATKKHYDLIFMDHMMPELDGVETLKKLKENPDFNTPVIVLTANYGEDLEKQYKEAGFAEYMMKPAEKECVKDILDRYYVNPGEDKRDKLVKSGFSIVDTLIANGISAAEYEEILDIFREESKEKLSACNSFYEAMDLKNYAIIVHGLKHDAALINDMELSELAKKHEMESKAFNKEYVLAQWPMLKKQWEDVLLRIESYFESK